MTSTWWSLLSAAVSGGLVVKLIDYVISFLTHSVKKKKNAKRLVDEHLDPLLKTADAICGKTLSLADRDFSTPHGTLKQELVALTYLYSAFWSRLVILDRESLGVSLNQDKRGRKLVAFRACLESQRIRLVDKTHQIAIGEIATEMDSSPYRTTTIVNFTRRIAESDYYSVWLEPLKSQLGNIHIKKTRQRMLVYGVILHAMIDTLDQNHTSTHTRSPRPNKLSRDSKRKVDHLVFKTYLKGTGAINRYTSSKKDARRAHRTH
ncbi:hypothetical protein [uncultured Salinisphaera sp.]|uniref:hypothetical protein n=1 Tax=uncultured Salinisphaera sp. TaxID=359372 RepID=UPI0032B18B36|tara:strand:- start:571 stop:1359 length:789 start_codon:yes stop_codon:yes gene_type:complete